MKTPTSNQEQNFTDSFDAEKNNKKKTPAEEVKEHPIPMQTETVKEHGKVGQKINPKNPDNSPSAKPLSQTPAEKNREQNLTEDDINPSKEERKAIEPDNKVGQPIGNKIPNKGSSAKPQSN